MNCFNAFDNFKKFPAEFNFYNVMKSWYIEQSASFGPFDRQVLILNENGKGFTLLENPQAMRLKEAGFINDKKQFIKQPTQQELEDALVAPESPNLLERIFGNQIRERKMDIKAIKACNVAKMEHHKFGNMTAGIVA